MRLATPEKVLAVMGVTESASTLQAASHALDLSFPVLEEVLDTRLAAATVIDYFDYRGPTSSLNFEGFSLRLTRGFVDQYSVTVMHSADGSPLGEDNAGVELATKYYRLDAEAGVIHVRQPIMSGLGVLSVSYESGFSESSDIPDTLQQIAVTGALLVLNTHPSSPANRQQKTVTNVSSSLFGHLKVAAQSIPRPRMSVSFPSSTEYL